MQNEKSEIKRYVKEADTDGRTELQSACTNNYVRVGSGLKRLRMLFGATQL